MKHIYTAKQLRTLSNSMYKGYFLMENTSTKLQRGIFQFIGKSTKHQGLNRRKIEWVTEINQKKTRAKKNTWLKRSTRRGASQSQTLRFWNRNVSKNVDRTMNRLFPK